jgi:acyl-homoserine-lactone acylase
MRIALLLTIAGVSLLEFVNAQVKPENITIVRDAWGVPHIFAATDAEVAYGLAWATAEDDFKTVQQQLLPAKGLAGLAMGKEGAIMDVFVHLLGARKLAEEQYEEQLSAEFRVVLEAYAEGLNAFAREHPDEVLHRKLFPITGKEMIPSYVLGVALMSGVQEPLAEILEGGYEEKPASEERGSNAVAIAPHKTTTGESFLLVNSHQPMEGLFSWYEAHLCSEEGWNILGATFPGGATIFHGVNEHLGWAHTVNHPDLTDVYRLEMHPEDKLRYRFDGQWLELEPYHYKARIRLLGLIPVGARQKFYKSKYGVAFKTDHGVFALRTTANQNIRAAEQWYHMNKAQNFADFRKALDLQGVTCTNIVYADREGHIYYLSNGLFPQRDEHYDWEGVLPGDTSATLWGGSYYPVDHLPQVKDPAAGYVFNCNHTPFLSSGPGEQPDSTLIPLTMGYQRINDMTNRGARFDALIRQYGQLSYEDFKEIKYDQSYETPMVAVPKFEPVFSLDEAQYPEIAAEIRLIRAWDREADAESEAASLVLLAFYYLYEELEGPDSFREGEALNEEMLVAALKHARKHLRKHFGSSRVPLGVLQQHRRGAVSLPMAGGPDVMAAIYSELEKDGRLRPIIGESYIQMARFSDKGVQIESVNAYGASNRPESPHYTDQMQLFATQQLKKMSLDREEVIKEAKRIYAPK